MDFLQYTAGPDDDGRRLDRVIRIVLKNVSMPEIYKYIRKGLVRVNDKKSDCNYRIKKDDKIRIPDFSADSKASVSQTEKKSAFISQADKELLVDKNIPQLADVFKNSFVRILNKPYGMSVHGGGTSDTACLEQIVKAQFVPENASLSFRPGPLHRIDRHTTGLVVFSQSLKGANVFSKMIQNHVVKKEYLAVLCGNLTSPETWEDALAAADDSHNKTDSVNFHTMKITERAVLQSSPNCDFRNGLSDTDVSEANGSDGKSGKIARTKVTPVAHGIYKGADITLALVEIETGRKHQIRCQCAEHGYPLLGDTAYGGKNPPGIDGHFLLHSWRMTFPPENTIGLPNTITAPLPEKFQKFLRNHLSQGEFSLYNID